MLASAKDVTQAFEGLRKTRRDSYRSAAECLSFLEKIWIIRLSQDLSQVRERNRVVGFNREGSAERSGCVVSATATLMDVGDVNVDGGKLGP